MSDSLWAMDCSPPGSSVHGILQARTLEWVDISFSRGSSQPRERTRVSCIAGRRFILWATREAQWLYALYFNTQNIRSIRWKDTWKSFLLLAQIPRFVSSDWTYLIISLSIKAKSFDCLIGTISPEPSLFLGSYNSLIYSDQGTMILLIVLQTYQPFSHPKTSALALSSAPEAFHVRTHI